MLHRRQRADWGCCIASSVPRRWHRGAFRRHLGRRHEDHRWRQEVLHGLCESCWLYGMSILPYSLGCRTACAAVGILHGSHWHDFRKPLMVQLRSAVAICHPLPKAVALVGHRGHARPMDDHRCFALCLCQRVMCPRQLSCFIIWGGCFGIEQGVQFEVSRWECRSNPGRYVLLVRVAVGRGARGCGVQGKAGLIPGDGGLPGRACFRPR